MLEIVCLEQMNNKEKLFKDLLYALTLSGKIFGTLIAGVILGLYLDSILLTKPLNDASLSYFSVYRSDENIIKRWKIMNEKLVFKKSFFIFLIGFIVFSIIGLMMKSISYSLGFLLGYLFNLAIFYVIIITSDMILNLKRSTSLIILLNIVKLAIYAIGFLIAIFIPKWFNLIGVLFGYMVIKITIYIVSYQMKEVKE